MAVDGDTSLHGRLARRIRARRDELGLTQLALAKRAGIGEQTIIRMEKGDFAKKRTTSWAKIEATLEWPDRFFDDYLAGRIDDEFEARYRPVPGITADVVEDMLYEAFIAGAPGAPIEGFDKARRAAFEFLDRIGVEVQPKNQGAPSRTSEEPQGND